ncbi:RluA family pseudouridine synthase [Haliscomenobacter hydrossis]|uniref:Pseudouridine synthase n=1 Tax=Haliscomenobacter hydrossis (strain ATCC 27775 / DSM 1100 / LMG 10767 / O) TaxID=760192 RepID=F4KZU6_HALH1|nr:RluA family pseudouridine synthase [Haliscomenobacter hydrossis]AEE51516.1 pseudouridine synthase [Haliscomenobacter hydrossis DSM 1100]
MPVNKPNWWLAETGAWIAVNKPFGFSVEKTLGADDTIEDQVLAYLSRQTTMPFVGIVHRLDRVTSGILLLAKKKSALRKLNEQFSQRSVKKMYWAMVEGIPQVPEATLSQWLYKDQKEKKAVVFDEPAENRDACQLHYRVVQHNQTKALLEIELFTGKFHQIRVQMAALGSPIIGDEKYGASHFSYADKGIALHARSLEFVDPQSGAPVVLVANLPAHPVWDFT